MRAKIQTETTCIDGVLRWSSVGRVVPTDILEFAAHFQIVPVSLERSAAARDEELTAFLAEYRRQQPSEPSAEEIYEARAAHGPGVKLVDVVTGRTFTT